MLDRSAVPPVPVEESRATVLKLSNTDKWIWGYNQADPSLDRMQSSPSFGTGPLLPTAGDVLTLSLAPPIFSVAGGQYNLFWFPKELALSPGTSNPPLSSEIFYNIDGAAWQKYSGPFSITDPGITVNAKSVSLDVDAYTDSVDATALYSSTPVTLDPATTLQTTYTYAGLGGPLAPGSLAPTLAPAARLILNNANEIPGSYQRDTAFQSFWTWDGTNPSVTGAGRISGINSFSNGYPGDPLNLTIASFAGSSSLTLKYVMQSKNSNLVSSAVKTATAVITTTRLLPPLVSPGKTSLTGAEKVTLALDVSASSTPANARIFYRTDGVDPGDVNGEPAAGAILYTAPIQLESIGQPTVNLVARVYSPTAYKSWFTPSQPLSQSYYLPYAGGEVYAVTGGDRLIYSLSPSTGANIVLSDTAGYNISSIALDVDKARIYYVENGSSTSGWRLGYYDFITTQHTTLGNLKANWSYSPAATPGNLAFFKGSLYFVPPSTDDLVRITLNAAATAITAVSKAADLRANNNWTTVGDLAVTETGLMFFVDSGKKYHRFNLNTMSGYLEVGSTADFLVGLTFYQGRLFGTKSGATNIQNLNPGSGKLISSVNAANSKMFTDLAAPTPAAPVTDVQSLWAVDDQSDGAHLIEFRNNYRNPLTSTAVDYGVLLADGTAIPRNDRFGIRALAISNSGTAYFVYNKKIRVGGKDQFRPLMSLNLAQLKLGDNLSVVSMGDLSPALQPVAGTIDPDDVITGLTLSPAGTLYGVLKEGASSGAGSADYLFKCTQPATAMTGSTIAVAGL